MPRGLSRIEPPRFILGNQSLSSTESSKGSVTAMVQSFHLLCSAVKEQSLVQTTCSSNLTPDLCLSPAPDTCHNQESLLTRWLLDCLWPSMWCTVYTPEPLHKQNAVQSHTHKQTQAHIHAQLYIQKLLTVTILCDFTLSTSRFNSNGYYFQFLILDLVCSEKTNTSSETSDDGCQSVKASVLSAVCVVSSTPDLCRPMTCQH